MFNKLLNVRKFAPFSSRGQPKPVAQPQQEPGDSQGTSSALKIVHAGGIVEYYYMAIPAVDIMKKYPSFILARPEVFRRPWDSLVRSHEILSPGEKFYLVPRRTVRKLRQRIKKPDNGEVPVNSFVSLSSIDVSKDGLSSKSFLKRNEVTDSSEVSVSFNSSSKKKNGRRKHVRFVGIDATKHKSGLSATKNSKDEGIAIAENSRKKSNVQGGKRKSRNGVLWQPSLAAISERDGPGE